MFPDRQAGTASKQSARDAAAELDPGWAWAPYEPDARRPWNLGWAGHLYRRAGFGASWQQLQQALEDGPQRAVDRLVRPKADVAALNQSFDEYENAAGRSSGSAALRAWWLRRMIETPHPLLEKMTLFWHSHFGISNSRVQHAPLMAQHVQLLRSHALGLYRPMLQAVANDPAVFLGLGADANRKALPNDDFARQLIERFGLGPGGCREEDVREAARAFTGWFVLRGRLRFFPREHDAGVKVVLGQRGNWQAEDVVRIILDQPAAPLLLARKLYRWLISEVDQPSKTLLEPLAEMLSGDYDVGQVVETMLRSNVFYSPAACRRRVKSPVEFALGMVKGLEATVSTVQLGADLSELGQNLYHPPTVKGWEGGRHWINAATLLGRSNLARALLATAGPYAGKLDPKTVTDKYGRRTLESSAQLLIDLLLQGDLADQTRAGLLEGMPPPDSRAGSAWLRELTYQVVTLPESQLG